MLGSLADTGLDLVAVAGHPVRRARSPRSPADRDHRFGHGKAEALAALVQVVLITRLGARHRLARGRPADRTARRPRDAEYGIGVSLVAIARDLRAARLSALGDRRTGSVAIRTDQVHYQSDLLLNLVGDRRAGARPVSRASPAPTPCSGSPSPLWLLCGAWRASSQAVDQLMDREWPEEKRGALPRRRRAEYPELAGLHDLRTRTSGTHDFAQFHVWVPGD